MRHLLVTLQYGLPRADAELCFNGKSILTNLKKLIANLNGLCVLLVLMFIEVARQNYVHFCKVMNFQVAVLYCKPFQKGFLCHHVFQLDSWLLYELFFIEKTSHILILKTGVYDIL